MDCGKDYIQMCDCEDMQSIFKDKLADKFEWEYQQAAVIWKNGHTEGLVGVLLTREPLYGLTWEGSDWWIHNGKIRGEHAKCLLSEEDPDARVIWLPRQDQLQGMVYESYKMDVTDSPYLRNLTMLRDIHEFTQMNRKNNISQLVSMEQLWLAFVMKEKYSKIWDGEKWI